ncbi:MAG: hypothetical protein HQ522_06000 [Bacteroidetes bacterium]|nr:hypothetical protein [Bacteroidota bacterium]
MKLPIISNTQSEIKGQKRLNLAIDSLGLDVVNKILSFSFYILGFPYDLVSTNFGFSEAGIKTLIQDILEDGVDRFLDKRKKVPYTILKKAPLETIINPTLKYNEQNKGTVEFMLTGPISFKIMKTDKIGKKLLSLIFLDLNLIKQIEVAKILNCNRLSVNQNYKKFKTYGSEGLLDNRNGQKKDYKFNERVKGEIIKKSILNILDNKVPSKTAVSNHLEETFSGKYSERAVALHLKGIGLTGNKEEIFSAVVQNINKKIDSSDYLRSRDTSTEGIYEKHVDLIQNFKEGLSECKEFDEDNLPNIFQLEKKIESFQSKMEALVLESSIDELKEISVKCPACQTSNTIKRNNSIECEKAGELITSLGGKLKSVNLPVGKCKNCKEEIDTKRIVLKLPEKAKFTPLTQKKICAANRAGSYENASKNLKELINIDINRNQIRTVSNHIGEYINKEFSGLHNDISHGLSQEIIKSKHPLVEELRIEKKYLDSSKYIIALAVDGGRMQMFDWIPPLNESEKGRKALRWHENKIFRISVYDKNNFDERTEKANNKTTIDKVAKMITGLSTYGATNVCWKDTAMSITSHLYMRGIAPGDVQICLSDGSEHIMNDIFNPLFPKSTHILDYYHKAEALHSSLKLLDTDENVQCKLKQYLWNGEIDKLTNELKKIQLRIGFPESGKKRNADNLKVKLDNLINHLWENKKRLNYKYFRDQRYPIGSGSVESAVKLFGKRVKGTEKQWNVDGGEAILGLYSFLLSEDGRWDKLWDIHTPWLENEVPF